MVYSSSITPQPALRTGNVTEGQEKIDDTHREGSVSSGSSEYHEVMEEIVSDLSLDCDNAFTPASSRSCNGKKICYCNQPQEEDQNQEISVSRSGKDQNPGMFELREMESNRAVTFGLSGQQDFLNDIKKSYNPSKHSSLSSGYRNGILESAISLNPPPDEKQRTDESLLREKRSEEDELGDQNSHIASNSAEAAPSISPEYPSTAKTILIMVSLYISIFLVALDRTIMGPAIPAITNQFNSISDIGWYGSAYMLTSAGFILLYGRIYTFFPTKIVFLSGIFLFEIGSAVCGAAQTSIMLIIGRAIAGLGSSGIFTGAILILLNTVPLHRRPLLQGLFGACFGVASVAGPLLGGAFTGSKLTWRWCFYINLPLGAVTILVVTFLLKLDERKPKLNGWKDTVKNMDPLGTILFLPSITCLLLALEWGAAEYAWSSPLLIALLVVFAILFVAFGLWQYFTRNTTATLPARILLQRSVAFGGASQFCVGSTMLTFSLYLPLWFQAIKGTSALQSGINTIPLVLSVVVGSILSGGLVQRIGYYTPFMILGSSLIAVGAGLTTIWNTATSSSMWIGNQVILGFGVGCTMQHPNLAIQVVLPRQDIPTGTAFLSLCQTLGGAVFTAVGQNLYIDKFSAGLQKIEGLDLGGILESGATELTSKVPPALRQQVIEAYNKSLTNGTFFAALIIACLGVPAALGMEWRSVKEKQNLPTAPAMQDEETARPVTEQTANSETPERSIIQSNPTIADERSLATPPVAKWRNVYRSSGRFTEWMTAKVNSDIPKSELSGRR